MWIDAEPIQREWHGGDIRIRQILYEFDGPIVFIAQVGLNELLFAKRDEGELADFFIAVETDNSIVEALSQGRLSLRGALDQADGWILETDLNQVFGFQHLLKGQFDGLLPPAKVGLYSRFGLVPDTLEQADALVSFRFVGPAIQDGQVPLSVLQNKINDFANFVRKEFLPEALMQGRDYKFFDVQMAEPKFSSLLLAAKRPKFDEEKISQSPRLGNIDPDLLNAQASEQGREFWEILHQTLDQIERTGEISNDFIVANQLFLENLNGLIPSDAERLNWVEVTYNDGFAVHTAIIEGASRRKIVEAQAQVENLDVRTIFGVIIEVNGDAGTFIIKDFAERQTTCDMPSADFEALDDNGQLYRGRQVAISGMFTRRTRRDYIWIEEPIAFQN